MAVSPLMLRKLQEIADSTEQTHTGVLEHTIKQYKIDILQITLTALKRKGYIEEYSINPFSDVVIYYYRVTDKGITYLQKYHNYELSNREN